MNNQKQLIFLFFIAICFILLFYHALKDIKPTSQTILAPISSRSIPSTCLHSYDANNLRKSAFNLSMVQLKTPPTLNVWIQNKTGFEIGGPSHFTWAPLGVYDVATQIDISNYAAYTMWDRGLADGSQFKWKNQTKGKIYVRDAVDLHGIPNDSYDFVLASHVIEHIANPFKALLEWLRILHTDGLLIIIAPLKTVTFDHKRDVIRLEHLIDDYHNQTNETDLSHLDEILRLHDIGRDTAAISMDAFKIRAEKNFINRGLHQHVFDQELLYYIYICLNLDVKIQMTWHNNNLIIGQKK